MARRETGGESTSERSPQGYQKHIQLPFEQKKLRWYFISKNGSIFCLRDAPVREMRAFLMPYIERLRDPRAVFPPKKAGGKPRKYDREMREEFAEICADVLPRQEWGHLERWMLCFAICESGFFAFPIYETEAAARAAWIEAKAPSSTGEVAS